MRFALPWSDGCDQKHGIATEQGRSQLDADGVLMLCLVCMLLYFSNWASEQHSTFGDSLLVNPEDEDAEGEEGDVVEEKKTSAPRNTAGGSTNTKGESSFLLQNRGMSLVKGRSEQYIHGSGILVDGLLTNNDESATVYSRLNASSPLTCSPPVSSTRYDTLKALRNRDMYPVLRELEVAVIFKKANSNIINLTAVEIDLKHAIAAVST